MRKYLVTKDELDNFVLIEQRRDSISNVIFDTRIQDEDYWASLEDDIIDEKEFDITEEENLLHGNSFITAIPKDAN